LVEENIVDGWDDPRMPTLVGIRRRGYTPESIHLFCERIGVAKSDGWIDMDVLESSLRDDLDPKVPRAMAVLDPVKLIIDNFAEEVEEPCVAPLHPHYPERGNRQFFLTRELWIEREDFMEEPVKGYFRLFTGNRVRLRYGYVVECTHYDKDETGRVVAVHCRHFPDSKSGTGSGAYKVKGNIHWVSVRHAFRAPVRLYDRLFLQPQPDAGDGDFRLAINPASRVQVDAYLEPGLSSAAAGERFQFERQGYFIVDSRETVQGQPVFNRIVTLRDSWGKRG
jgi:glutaminyl-tRNA synthetase